MIRKQDACNACHACNVNDDAVAKGSTVIAWLAWLQCYSEGEK